MTFRSARGNLPKAALEQACANILVGHGKTYRLSLAVGMPDHVHLLLCPLEDGGGLCFDLSDIMKGIKGTSARRINQLLGTAGTVWQEGYFDRIIRDESELQRVFAYTLNNPVRAGLADDPWRYPYLLIPSG
ncbi:MAG: transposase [candidate division Zixibacteria bacterium]|nr:transposase [candidate division Zixibacteria bacterium]